MKDRRTYEEIYLKLLTAIQDLTNGEPPKLTTVQLYSGISYDKAKLYAERLEKYKLLTLHPLKLTSKGAEFIKEYNTFFTDYKNEKKNIKQAFFSGDGSSWKELRSWIAPIPPSKYENRSSHEVIELHQQINNLNALLEMAEGRKK